MILLTGTVYKLDIYAAEWAVWLSYDVDVTPDTTLFWNASPNIPILG